MAAPAPEKTCTKAEYEAGLPVGLDASLLLQVGCSFLLKSTCGIEFQRAAILSDRAHDVLGRISRYHGAGSIGLPDANIHLDHLIEADHYNRYRSLSIFPNCCAASNEVARI